MQQSPPKPRVALLSVVVAAVGGRGYPPQHQPRPWEPAPECVGGGPCSKAAAVAAVRQPGRTQEPRVAPPSQPEPPPSEPPPLVAARLRHRLCTARHGSPLMICGWGVGRRRQTAHCPAAGPASAAAAFCRPMSPGGPGATVQPPSQGPSSSARTAGRHSPCAGRPVYRPMRSCGQAIQQQAGGRTRTPRRRHPMNLGSASGWRQSPRGQPPTCEALPGPPPAVATLSGCRAQRPRPCWHRPAPFRTAPACSTPRSDCRRMTSPGDSVASRSCTPEQHRRTDRPQTLCSLPPCTH
mmetsp:Transcript_8748/g.26344  ORF Transcript_8748/g.26344 Transcript_8748/m.26344 type:complete len:295 (+) Transcript_8748:2277-3161(+)